ncbi:hypothetical protein D9Q98_010561 [Chlorella vulgaris]|uniref:Uncharacterized protein n=1 Tax=Chlorella vulgaris TaxID=3077 RepID=A0A9D4YXU8_CHLVU|nr:hypothetical protein D9Q98_010561 [Chlorella vulgaris]
MEGEGEEAEAPSLEPTPAASPVSSTYAEPAQVTSPAQARRPPRCPACGALALTADEMAIVRKPGRRSKRDPADPRNRPENLLTVDFLNQHIAVQHMSLRDIGAYHGYTISTLSRRAKQDGIHVGHRARAHAAEEAAAARQASAAEHGGTQGAEAGDMLLKAGGGASGKKKRKRAAGRAKGRPWQQQGGVREEDEDEDEEDEEYEAEARVVAAAKQARRTAPVPAVSLFDALPIRLPPPQQQQQGKEEAQQQAEAKPVLTTSVPVPHPPGLLPGMPGPLGFMPFVQSLAPFIAWRQQQVQQQQQQQQPEKQPKQEQEQEQQQAAVQGQQQQQQEQTAEQVQAAMWRHLGLRSRTKAPPASSGRGGREQQQEALAPGAGKRKQAARRTRRESRRQQRRAADSEDEDSDLAIEGLVSLARAPASQDPEHGEHSADDDGEEAAQVEAQPEMAAPASPSDGAARQPAAPVKGEAAGQQVAALHESGVRAAAGMEAAIGTEAPAADDEQRMAQAGIGAAAERQQEEAGGQLPAPPKQRPEQASPAVQGVGGAAAHLRVRASRDPRLQHAREAQDGAAAAPAPVAAVHGQQQPLLVPGLQAVLRHGADLSVAALELGAAVPEQQKWKEQALKAQARSELLWMPTTAPQELEQQQQQQQQQQPVQQPPLIQRQQQLLAGSTAPMDAASDMSGSSGKRSTDAASGAGGTPRRGSGAVLPLSSGPTPRNTVAQQQPAPVSAPAAVAAGGPHAAVGGAKPAEVLVSPVLPPLAGSSVAAQAAQHLLVQAVNAFQAADISVPKSMLRPLRWLTLAGKGGPLLKEVVSHWDSYAPSKQIVLFSTAVAVASQGAWDSLEDSLELEMQE